MVKRGKILPSEKLKKEEEMAEKNEEEIQCRRKSGNIEKTFTGKEGGLFTKGFADIFICFDGLYLLL